MKVSKEPKENLTDNLYLTFFAAFLFLSGTTLLTLLASLSANENDQAYLKQALISETAVNIIASVTYYYLMKELFSGKLSLKNVTSIRYLDWVFTTPLLLFSFVLYTRYSYQPGQDTNFEPLIYIILLNIAMLYFGYMGETKRSNYTISLILGFACYAGLMYLLYINYVADTNDSNLILYCIFVAIWGFYGISYMMPLREKNISYNILDLVSKAGFGVFIWMSMVVKNSTQNVATLGT